MPTEELYFSSTLLLYFEDPMNDPEKMDALNATTWSDYQFLTSMRKTDDNLLLLKTEMEEGHFGGSDRYKYMRELAFSYTFVLKTYGMLVDYRYDIEYSN